MAKNLSNQANTSGKEAGYAGNNKERKADAWGNIQLKSKDGEVINFSSGMNPVYAEQNQIHRSLYKAAAANGGTIEIPATFVVKVAPKDDGSDIEFAL
ncbi:hypothetical protein A5gp_00068 [Alteromonas phage vB_AemP_PT15-A5]|nr:hypothetical protein A5gp_00068 [Alteromonas phage vB_AemP_PT15-A5]